MFLVCIDKKKKSCSGWFVKTKYFCSSSRANRYCDHLSRNGKEWRLIEIG